jgi:REP element-mobilizing transposase RayT
VIIASHVIFTAYGFWLPNDPRGSWSDFVASFDLFLFGPATKTTAKKSLASVPHDPAVRRAAKRALLRRPVRFTGVQAQSIGHGFRKAAHDGGYVCYACAILPDHVHLVLARHQRPIKQIVGHLKAMASRELASDGRHPFVGETTEDGSLPTPWVRGCWKRYLNTQQEVSQAIQYVEQNPVRIKLPRQRWSFVTPFGSETPWKRTASGAAKLIDQTAHQTRSPTV